MKGLQGTECQGRIHSGNCQCGEVQPPLPWFHRCEIRIGFEGEKAQVGEVNPQVEGS